MPGWRNKRNKGLNSFFPLLLLAGSLAFAGGCALAMPEETAPQTVVGPAQEQTTQTGLNGKSAASPAVGALAGIKVSFKLDPLLTQSLYMGDRWVSPPKYSSILQKGKELTVEARVQGVDTRGRPLAIHPQWVPADPQILTVSPAQGDHVKITVKRAGQTSLQVTADGITRQLLITATGNDTAMRVEISQ
jgi:hypothetical protein